MAHYTIARACGHTDTLQLYGPRAERERRIGWEEQRQCADCVAQAREDAAKIAAAHAASVGLPTLVGSPKQVVWAEQIRAKILPQIQALPVQNAPADKAPIACAAQDAVLAQSAAAWWIDHRDMSGVELWRELARALSQA